MAGPSPRARRGRARKPYSEHEQPGAPARRVEDEVLAVGDHRHVRAEDGRRAARAAAAGARRGARAIVCSRPSTWTMRVACASLSVRAQNGALAASEGHERPEQEQPPPARAGEAPSERPPRRRSPP